MVVGRRREIGIQGGVRMVVVVGGVMVVGEGGHRRSYSIYHGFSTALPAT